MPAHPRGRDQAPHPRAVLGVWSPFGQAYACHGEVNLKLGKKPQRHGAEKEKEAKLLASAPPPPPDDEPTLPPRTPPGPPIALKPGLGLGMGLHPQRFPRQPLHSSERRVRACCASRRLIDGLRDSSSEPSLWLPASPHSSVAELPEPRRLPAIEKPPPLPRLPIAVRYAAEFRGVQRRSRLKLEAMLEERERLRASVVSLRHARIALSPMVISRHDGRSSVALARVGTKTLWHEASERIRRADGGALELWQALHACIREREPAAPAEELPPPVEKFMREVHSRLAEGEPIGEPLVERLLEFAQAALRGPPAVPAEHREFVEALLQTVAKLAGIDPEVVSLSNASQADRTLRQRVRRNSTLGGNNLQPQHLPIKSVEGSLSSLYDAEASPPPAATPTTAVADVPAIHEEEEEEEEKPQDQGE
ncbi:hypothetical protein AB1Y20_013270 [Prymnesium parvum]|uniref:Uncharacterized protein n=1 Tax=Prymnesium parvum TaxID=97485 RepID=A0AB34IL79_PRYPA